MLQVLDPLKIADHYRKSTKFKTDLLAILPVGTAYNLITGTSGTCSSTFHTSNYFEWLFEQVHIIGLHSCLDQLKFRNKH